MGGLIEGVGNAVGSVLGSVTGALGLAPDVPDVPEAPDPTETLDEEAEAAALRRDRAVRNRRREAIQQGRASTIRNPLGIPGTPDAGTSGRGAATLFGERGE